MVAFESYRRRGLCIGVGNCVAVAPTVFVLDAENKAVVIDASTVNQDKLVEAAESCPVNAITIKDDQLNPIYP